MMGQQVCRRYGDPHGDSHGYGYGVGMGIEIPSPWQPCATDIQTDRRIAALFNVPVWVGHKDWAKRSANKIAETINIKTQLLFVILQE